VGTWKRKKTELKAKTSFAKRGIGSTKALMRTALKGRIGEKELAH